MADSPSSTSTTPSHSAEAPGTETTQKTKIPTIDELTVVAPDDWHLHLRDGDRLQSLLQIPLQCKRAIIMPNLKPPVTTTEHAIAYRERIMVSCVCRWSRALDVFVGCYEVAKQLDWTLVDVLSEVTA